MTELASHGAGKKDVQVSCVSVSNSRLDKKEDIDSHASWRAKIRAAVRLRWLCGAGKGVCEETSRGYEEGQIRMADKTDDAFIMGYSKSFEHCKLEGERE